MLRSMKELQGYGLEATDGTIGRCHDFLFDDRRWVVRYMVADPGKWIPDRRVVIDPLFLDEPDWAAKRFPVRLTKDRIEASPDLEEHEPVARRARSAAGEAAGLTWWPPLGAAEAAWVPPLPAGGTATAVAAPPPDTAERQGDPALRSFDEVKGYHIQALDDEVGHVEDMMVDDHDWTVRYLVIDTRNWLPGRKVLVSPNWLHRLDWSEQVAEVDLEREHIEKSPEYRPGRPIHRGYESRLHTHFGRNGYWTI